MPALHIERAAALLERQSSSGDFKVIPTVYGGLYDSLAPGIIAGIVLGSVAGFLLLLFICYSALGMGPPIFSKFATEGSVVEVRTRRTSRGASHSSRRTSRQTRSPKRRRRPSIVSAHSYEARTYERVHVVPPPRRSGGGGPIIVDAAPSSPHTLTDSEEDEVVVIEEGSTPPRRNRRERSYDRRRSPGY